MFKKIACIINPTAGGNQPVLKPIVSFCNRHAIEYEFFITKTASCPQSFIEDIDSSHFDAVAVYGGDGTVSVAALALKDSHLPLLVLPGGTGNAIAKQLGIPLQLEQALESLLINGKVHGFDCGTYTTTESFFMRLSIGPVAEYLQSVRREDKDNLGSLAYLTQLLTSLQTAQPQQFKFTIDEKPIECTGLALFVVNWGNTGVLNFNLAPNIHPDDGRFTVICVSLETVQDLLTIATGMGTNISTEQVQTWSCTQFKLHCDGKKFPVMVDDHIKHVDKLACKIQKQVINLVVPQ